MKMQYWDPKIISITQLRRDIDLLEKALASYQEAWVMRNQDLLFVAITPEKYTTFYKNMNEKEEVSKAISAIDKLRATIGKAKKPYSLSNFVSQMREERIKKWKK